MDLFDDRRSAAKMKANQLCLWFSSAAYVLLSGLQRLGLAATELAQAQCGTIRLKLLKIGPRSRLVCDACWCGWSVTLCTSRMVVRSAFHNSRRDSCARHC